MSKYERRFVLNARTVNTRLLCFSFVLTECKLSRSGPPATIVTIDEESPNGKS